MRSRADDAEAMFLTALVAVEKTSAWRAVALLGEVTFEDWITKNHICHAARYANWRQATEVLEFEVMGIIGVPASIRLAGVVDHEKRALVQELMLETARLNRRPLSAQNARRKVEQICGSMPRPLSQKSRVEQMKAELRVAYARITELNGMVTKLQAELAQQKTEETSV